MPPAFIPWRAPGSVHHAKWMPKFIHSIKIYLFHKKDVVKLTKKGKLQLKRFVHFGALLYTKSWFSASQATEAPAQDLQLWCDLKTYEQIDPQIGTAVRKVVENHLWYLSDELVGLALFSDNAFTKEKLAVVQG